MPSSLEVLANMLAEERQERINSINNANNYIRVVNVLGKAICADADKLKVAYEPTEAILGIYNRVVAHLAAPPSQTTESVPQSE